MATSGTSRFHPSNCLISYVYLMSNVGLGETYLGFAIDSGTERDGYFHSQAS